MKLTVSGKEKEYADGITIAELLEIEKVASPRYVNVAVNKVLVDRSKVAEHVLADGDDVEFLYYWGGGSYGAAP